MEQQELGSEITIAGTTFEAIKPHNVGFCYRCVFYENGCDLLDIYCPSSIIWEIKDKS